MAIRERESSNMPCEILIAPSCLFMTSLQFVIYNHRTYICSYMYTIWWGTSTERFEEPYLIIEWYLFPSLKISFIGRIRKRLWCVIFTDIYGNLLWPLIKQTAIQIKMLYIAVSLFTVNLMSLRIYWKTNS